MKKKIEEIRELKYKVQEQMIESEKSEEVTQWSADLENIPKTVTPSAVIKWTIAKFKHETENFARDLKDKEEEKRIQKRLEEKFEKWKQKLRN